MKKLYALALAAAVGLTGLTAFGTAASAAPRGYWPNHGYHNPHTIPYPFGAPRSGFYLNFGFGGPGFYGYNRRGFRPPPPPVRYGVSAHVRWCLNRYKTYNPATNTYFRRVGVPAVCVSPYRY